MKIDLTATAGARPTWLKDDDIVLSRYYSNTGRTFTDRREACDDLIGWSSYFLAEIEIEDTHPYAVATSLGYTYHGGSNAPPEDAKDGTSILLRNGRIREGHPGNAQWDWSHNTQPHSADIIGYHRAISQPLQTYNVSTNIKFEVEATSTEEAHARAVSLLEDMHLVSYGGLVITEPVDPDLMLVRKIFAEQADNDNCPATADEIREGYQDHSRNIRLALAAFKAARA